MKLYDSGDLVRFHATFTASGGGTVDPASVYFETRDPSGNFATYGWPANVTRSGVGAFYIDLLATHPGDYWYRFFGAPSAGLSAAEGTFGVRSSFVL